MNTVHFAILVLSTFTYKMNLAGVAVLCGSAMACGLKQLCFEKDRTMVIINTDNEDVFMDYNTGTLIKKNMGHERS